MMGSRGHRYRHTVSAAALPPLDDSLAHTGRAFLIHFRADADPGAGRVCGRVQHVRSGDATHFDSVEQLIAFVDARLGRVQPT